MSFRKTANLSKIEKDFLDLAKTMPSPFSVRSKNFSTLYGGGIMGMSDAIKAYQGLQSKGIIQIVDRDFNGDATKAVIVKPIHKNPKGRKMSKTAMQNKMDRVRSFRKNPKKKLLPSQQIINTDWNDLNSIKRSEKMKAKLENAGYSLIKTQAGLTTSKDFYILKNPRVQSKAKYKHKDIRSPSTMSKGSIRTVSRGSAKIRVGCPKGSYSKKTKKCKVGTRAVSVLTPLKNPKASSYPFHSKKWKVFALKVKPGGQRLPARFYWNGAQFNSEKRGAVLYDSKASATKIAKDFRRRYSGKSVVFGINND